MHKFVTLTLLSQGSCRSAHSDDKNAPSLDELLNDSAAILKSKLQDEAEYCVKEFKKKILVGES